MRRATDSFHILSSPFNFVQHQAGGDGPPDGVYCLAASHAVNSFLLSLAGRGASAGVYSNDYCDFAGRVFRLGVRVNFGG